MGKMVWNAIFRCYFIDKIKRGRNGSTEPTIEGGLKLDSGIKYPPTSPLSNCFFSLCTVAGRRLPILADTSEDEGWSPKLKKGTWCTISWFPDSDPWFRSLDYGYGSDSGFASCSFWQWLSRCQQKNYFFPKFFCLDLTVGTYVNISLQR